MARQQRKTCTIHVLRDDGRPPGALPGAQFQETCAGCGDCVAVCPRRALRLGRADMPVLTDPGSCQNCGLCADVCMLGAIRLTQATRAGLQTVLTMERRLDQG
ncbi:MAG: 4Fe-4S dicluster domain-containing protein [Pseudomonadota bacterium]